MGLLIAAWNLHDFRILARLSLTLSMTHVLPKLRVEKDVVKRHGARSQAATRWPAADVELGLRLHGLVHRDEHSHGLGIAIHDASLLLRVASLNASSDFRRRVPVWLIAYDGSDLEVLPCIGVRNFFLWSWCWIRAAMRVWSILVRLVIEAASLTFIFGRRPEIRFVERLAAVKLYAHLLIVHIGCDVVSAIGDLLVGEEWVRCA